MMIAALRVLVPAIEILCGLAVTLAVWRSIMVTIILPRGASDPLAGVIWIISYRIITAIARRERDQARRDDILALLGPLNIIVLLFSWMGLFAFGFAAIFMALGGTSFGNALDVAGSSIFTLGVTSGSGVGNRFFMYLAAASGVIVVGLQIGYLPTLYSAYSRREELVTLLNMRCQEGGILNAETILQNFSLPRSRQLLSELYASWEAAAAAIVESHTNYRWLIVFRSPRQSESWITAIFALLDSISLLTAVSPADISVEAENCRFACVVALREVSRNLRPQPRRRRHPRMTEADFAATVAKLGHDRAGRTVRECWDIFRTARQEYEAFAFLLADFILIEHERGMLQLEEAP